jgi:hypothetical protein
MVEGVAEFESTTGSEDFLVEGHSEFSPINAELTRRHIRERGHCTACGNESEYLYHVMVQCPGAKKFWSEVKKLTGQKLPDLHPLTWATDLLQGSLCSLADAVFVCGGWSL